MIQDIKPRFFQKPSKVVVIGTGLVGATYAYSLLVEGTTDEICLIDINREKSLGEAMDLNHAMPFAKRTQVWAGTMDDVQDADVVVIAAGAAQKPGETRMDLLSKNANIVGTIAEEAGRLAPDAIFLVVTNPVDVMSYVAMVRSKLPPERVMGSGTVLDTGRLRFLLAGELGIDPRSVHATVLGEHGDSELVAWSRATVAGTSLATWPELSQKRRGSIFSQIRDAAYEIIDLKGATYYAIALALTRITESILKDLRTVYPVSTYLGGEYGICDVYLGNPSVVGRGGVLRTIELPLSGTELAQLRESARKIKQAIQSLNLPQPAFSRKPLAQAANFEASQELTGQEETAQGNDQTTSLRKMRKPRPIKPRVSFRKDG